MPETGGTGLATIACGRSPPGDGARRKACAKRYGCALRSGYCLAPIPVACRPLIPWRPGCEWKPRSPRISRKGPAPPDDVGPCGPVPEDHGPLGSNPDPEPRLPGDIRRSSGRRQGDAARPPCRRLGAARTTGCWMPNGTIRNILRPYLLPDRVGIASAIGGS